MKYYVTLALGTLMFFAANASAQSGTKVDATMKLIDPDKNVALITVNDDMGGIRILELPIPPDTKFETPKGKKIKDGIRSDIFKSPINRPAVPITIQYETINGRQVMKKIVVRQ